MIEVNRTFQGERLRRGNHLCNIRNRMMNDANMMLIFIILNFIRITFTTMFIYVKLKKISSYKPSMRLTKAICVKAYISFLIRLEPPQ